MTALLDGDSLFHIIAYNFKDVEKDFGSIDEVESTVDSFVRSILTMVRAKSYYGLLSDPRRKYFRTLYYKYKPYKGSRPPEEEWMIRWRPTIRNRLEGHWGFFHRPYLEADDLISYLNEQLMVTEETGTIVICSPDKDLDQCPGWHFDYKKCMDTGAMRIVTKEQAHLNLWMSVITGDSSDDVAGIPFKGPDKAAKCLQGLESIEYKLQVKNQYIKYFGPHYGPKIFEETHMAMMMMTTRHPYYRAFKKVLSEVDGERRWIPNNTRIFAE